MKHNLHGIAIAIAFMAAGTANAADGNVRIKGELKGLKDSLIVFSPSENGKNKRDTVLTPNGKFDFTIQLKEPAYVSAYTPGSIRDKESIGFQLVAVPGETAELSGDVATKYTTTGSKFYKQYNEASQALEKTSKPYQEYVESLNKRLAAGEDRKALMQEYESKSPALQKQMLDGIFDYIKQNPNSEAAAAFIPELEELDKMKEAANLLSPEIRNGRMKPIYQNVIDKLERRAQAEKESAAKQAAGVAAPDFTLNDNNGKPLSLSSLKGKYVVLDFWGSWCIWCIKGFPEMKNYYEKYKGKFEILGIDCNDTEAKWKAAIEKHQLPWLHVYNPRDSKLLNAYGVQGFPTKIILGPDGKIIKTVVGEDPAFYTFLDELFGK